MLKKIHLLILPLIILISGCNNNGAIKEIGPEKVQTKTAIDQVKTARPGSVIFEDKSMNIHPSITLHSGAHVKSSSWVGPRLKLRKGDKLVKLLENKKYEYYATKKHYEKLDEIITSMLTAGKQHARLANSQGIRRNKKSGKLDGFVISNDHQYTYALPKDMEWENRTGYFVNTKNKHQMIIFRGIDNKELVFSYYDLLNKPKAFRKTKHHEITKVVRAPLSTKKVKIDNHEIAILSVNNNNIRYKILS